jgi:penicillin-binding protein 2
MRIHGTVYRVPKFLFATTTVTFLLLTSAANYTQAAPPSSVAHKTSKTAAVAGSVKTTAAKSTSSAAKARATGKTGAVHKAGVSRTPLVAGSARSRAASAAAARRAAKRRYDPWKEPNFTTPTEGDDPSGEDPLVRQAAVDALGNFNGTIVVADPSTGRVLSVVNQKVAFKDGFTPCSTIKLMTSLAALNEGLVDRTTLIPVARRTRLDMTDALAKSDNAYFAILGQRMGFDKVTYYARLFGLGEKAGFNIPEEQSGSIVDTPEKGDGVGMMCSFGHGFKMTPLELAAMIGAIANNGTLYYMQYPRTAQALRDMKPLVKRQLPIQASVQEMLPGMMGAVEFGTARRAGLEQTDSSFGMLYGKTGTCTDTSSPTHMGWFGSFNQIGSQKLVAVVMLTGGRAVNGPVASGVAGAFFRNLSRNSYFRQSAQQDRTTASARPSQTENSDETDAGQGPEN